MAFNSPWKRSRKEPGCQYSTRWRVGQRRRSKWMAACRGSFGERRATTGDSGALAGFRERGRRPGNGPPEPRMAFAQRVLRICDEGRKQSASLGNVLANSFKIESLAQMTPASVPPLPRKYGRVRVPCVLQQPSRTAADSCKCSMAMTVHPCWYANCSTKRSETKACRRTK